MSAHGNQTDCEVGIPLRMLYSQIPNPTRLACLFVQAAPESASGMIFSLPPPITRCGFDLSIKLIGHLTHARIGSGKIHKVFDEPDARFSYGSNSGKAKQGNIFFFHAGSLRFRE